MSEKFPFENYTLEGAVSHNVLYNQHLSIARHQVSFLSYRSCEQNPSIVQMNRLITD